MYQGAPKSKVRDFEEEGMAGMLLGSFAFTIDTRGGSRCALGSRVHCTSIIDRSCL